MMQEWKTQVNKDLLHHLFSIDFDENLVMIHYFLTYLQINICNVFN